MNIKHQIRNAYGREIRLYRGGVQLAAIVFDTHGRDGCYAPAIQLVIGRRSWKRVIPHVTWQQARRGAAWMKAYSANKRIVGFVFGGVA